MRAPKLTKTLAQRAKLLRTAPRGIDPGLAWPPGLVDQFILACAAAHKKPLPFLAGMLLLIVVYSVSASESAIISLVFIFAFW